MEVLPVTAQEAASGSCAHPAGAHPGSWSPGWKESGGGAVGSGKACLGVVSPRSHLSLGHFPGPLGAQSYALGTAARHPLAMGTRAPGRALLLLLFCGKLWPRGLVVPALPLAVSPASWNSRSVPAGSQPLSPCRIPRDRPGGEGGAESPKLWGVGMDRPCAFHLGPGFGAQVTVCHGCRESHRMPWVSQRKMH